MTARSQHMFEAALVVLVPEADGLVGPFREKYDPSALQGMAAHITINYPFRPKQRDGKLVVEQLTDLFSGWPSIRFSLTQLRQSSDTLYLAVEPDQPFKNLINAVVNQYPESPPYGGVSDEVVPHVTVAEPKEESAFERIRWEFALASKGRLPIEALAKEVWLMNYEKGIWSKQVRLGLAS